MADKVEEGIDLQKMGIKITQDLIKVIGGIGGAGLVGIMGKMLATTHSLIKVTADMGMTTRGASDHFRGVTDALSNSTDQFAALGMALSLQRVGIDGNNLSIMKMMEQQRLLVGGNAEVVKAMHFLRKTTGMSSIMLGDLMEHIQKETKGRMVSTSDIIEAMQGLKEQLRTAAVLGNSGPLAKALISLNTRLPGMQEEFGSFVGALTDGSEQGLRNVIMAGVRSERSILAHSKDSGEIADAIIRAVIKWGTKTEQYTEGLKGGMDRYLMDQVFTREILGKNSAATLTLMRAVLSAESSETEETNRRNEAMKTLNAAWGSFKHALQDNLIPVMVSILSFITKLLGQEWFRNFVKTMFKFSVTLIVIFGGLTAGLMWLASKIVQLIEYLRTLPFMGGMSSSFLPTGTPSIIQMLRQLGGDADLIKSGASTAKGVAKLVKIEEEREARARSRDTNIGGVQAALMAGFSDRFRNSETKRTNSLMQTLIEMTDDIVRQGKKPNARGLGGK